MAPDLKDLQHSLTQLRLQLWVLIEQHLGWEVATNRVCVFNKYMKVCDLQFCQFIVIHHSPD